MGRRIKKLTPTLLKRMIMQERRRMRRRVLESSDPIVAGVEDPAKVSAEEVDAPDLADSLEKDIDHIKALKIQERKLRNRLKRVAEAKTTLKRRVLRKLN